MNINKILGTIITALSVSTVLVTLMSFLIFKIRQFPKKKNAADEPIEGVYFRKYDPFQEQICVEEKPPIRSSRLLQINAIGYFGLTSLCIFVAIFAQSYFENRAHDQAVLAAAQKKQAHEDELHAAGLLKKITYDSALPNEIMTEFISRNQQSRSSRDLASVQALKITLVENHDAKFSPFHESAVRVWETYLLRAKIGFVKSTLDLIPAGTQVVILPELKSLSKFERDRIADLLKKHVGILATGPVGYLNADGTASSTNWIEETFGVSMSANGDSAHYFPTFFAGDRAPFANLPAGWTANWIPDDNSTVASSKANTVLSAYASDEQGRLKTDLSGRPVARATFNELSDESRAGWLAFDPAAVAKFSVSQQAYADAFLLNSLKWTAGTPGIQMSSWKNGAGSALLTSVDSEMKFEGATRLLRMFKQKQVPATFFIVSDLLRRDPTLAQEATAEMDLQSHTTDHTILQGADPKVQFEKIEGSRLAIEDVSGRRVYGFRPPEERYDESTLNVAIQNKIEFFLGDQKFYRFAPLQIAAGRLLYFPRSAFDDFNLVKRNSTNAEILSDMKADYSRVELAGGAYFLNMHSQVFGQPEYQTVVSDFLDTVSEKGAWRANFAQATAWWKAREAVTAQIDITPAHAYEIKIENTGDSEIDAPVFFVDAPGATDWRSDSSVKFEAVDDPDFTRLRLGRLAAHQSVLLKSNAVEKPVEVPLPEIHLHAPASVVSRPALAVKKQKKKHRL